MTAAAMLVDTHAHLDSVEFNADRDAVLERAGAARVKAVVTVGVDIGSSRAAVGLAAQYPALVAAVGIHPHEASTCDGTALSELRRLARDARAVAIGEIGLDYYRDRSPRPAQRWAFQSQLALAAELGLPVIVHDREAHGDVFADLAAFAGGASSRLTGVLHCFSGDVGLMNEAVRLGFYVSLAGTVTYPQAARLAEVARAVPADRLLVETDCPYLAPQPVRGGRNEPAFVRHTAAHIAGLRGEQPDAIGQQTTENARRLFGPRLPV